MKNQQHKGSEGFTLIELMIVIAIMGVLASIAIPNYLKYRLRGYDSACLTNRRNIETAEIAYLASNDMPSLSIGERYSCPLDGIYVWLVTDPEDPEYPEVACSVHYAGSTALPDQPSDSPLDSPPGDTDDSADPPPEDTPDPPPQEVDEPVNSPGEEIGNLIDHVLNLNLPDDVEDALMERLTMAQRRYDRGSQQNLKNAIRALNWFKNRIKQNRKKIDDSDEAYLKDKADEIQDAIRNMM